VINLTRRGRTWQGEKRCMVDAWDVKNSGRDLYLCLARGSPHSEPIRPRFFKAKAV
jgi:hypothetical protein